MIKQNFRIFIRDSSRQLNLNMLLPAPVSDTTGGHRWNKPDELMFDASNKQCNNTIYAVKNSRQPDGLLYGLIRTANSVNQYHRSRHHTDIFISTMRPVGFYLICNIPRLPYIRPDLNVLTVISHKTVGMKQGQRD